MEKLNIIFVHKGNSWYLPYALKQAKKSNPNANIFLLGDESNDRYPFIKHYMISDYFSSAKEFSKIYLHLSSSGFDYELFCFQRWFVWLEFMEKNNINNHY